MAIRDFSEVLRECVEKSGMGTWALSVRCGVSEETLEAYMRGEKYPSGPVLENMCNILGIEKEKTSLGVKKMTKVDFEALLTYIEHAFLTEDQKLKLIRAIEGR